MTENPSVFIVFGETAVESNKILKVAASLEDAIEFLGLSYGRKDSKLYCRYSDAWQYEVDNHKFEIRKHFIYGD